MRLKNKTFHMRCFEWQNFAADCHSHARTPGFSGQTHADEPVTLPAYRHTWSFVGIDIISPYEPDSQGIGRS
jgi:hypothetical protein